MVEHQGKKLKEYLSRHRKPGEKKKNIAEIAVELGVSKATLYNYFLRSELDDDFLEELDKKGYKFNLDESPKVAEAIPAYLPSKTGNIIFVPIYAYGGFLHGYADPLFLENLEKFTLPGIIGEHYAFEVRGNSMIPFAQQGEMIIVKKEDKLEWMVKDDVYLLQTVDGMIVKVFQKIQDGKAYFKSKNSSGENPVIPLKNIKAVYLVVQVLKSARNII